MTFHPALKRRLVAAMLLLPLPALAQVPPDPVPPQEPPGLMQRGAEMFLRGLLDEAGPALVELDRAWSEIAPELERIGPLVTGLVDMVEDIRNYETPVRMPNGDILIRRKPDAPALPVLPDVPELPELPPEAPGAGPDAVPPDMPDMSPAPEIDL